MLVGSLEQVRILAFPARRNAAPKSSARSAWPSIRWTAQRGGGWNRVSGWSCICASLQRTGACLEPAAYRL